MLFFADTETCLVVEFVLMVQAKEGGHDGTV